MNRLWGAIRFSSVGVMLASVGLAIAGCSAEDAIKAFLIWLALALGSGATEETIPGGGATALAVCASGGTTACALDNYTDAETITALCETAEDDRDTNPAPGTLFNRRQIDDDTSNTTTGVTMSIGAGINRIANTGGVACTLGLISYPPTGLPVTAIDLSAYTTVTYAVTIFTGSPPTGCTLDVSDDVGLQQRTGIALTAGNHTVTLGTGLNSGTAGAFDPTTIAFVQWPQSCAGSNRAPANTDYQITPFVFSP